MDTIKNAGDWLLALLKDNPIATIVVVIFFGIFGILLITQGGFAEVVGLLFGGG